MKKVITYGTYDLFHRGHYNMLKRAKEYGDYLIVGVTGDSYDTERGKLSVRDSIDKRIENVKNTGLVDEIIIEEYLGQKISDIVRNGVDTFVIGDDWKGKFDHLSKYCNLVYLERTPGISSTQVREETFNYYDIGIITDDERDGYMIEEAKNVIGFNVTHFYADDDAVAESFENRYHGTQKSDSIEECIDSVDIVYVRTNLNKKYDIIKMALCKGKHVIANVPFTLESKKQRRLFEYAKENHVLLIDNIKMVYLKVFFQLLWMTKGNLIGDIYRFKCAMSYKNSDAITEVDYMLALSICMMIKVMGTEYSDMQKNVKYDKNGDIEYLSLAFKYKDAMATIDIGSRVPLENNLEIVGKTGTIYFKDDWWKPSYFEIKRKDVLEIEKYSANFKGNGLKYVIKELAALLDNGNEYSKCLFPEESIKIIEIIEKIRFEKNI